MKKLRNIDFLKRKRDLGVNFGSWNFNFFEEMSNDKFKFIFVGECVLMRYGLKWVGYGYVDC